MRHDGEGSTVVPSARVALVFSSVGHTCMHLFSVYFLLVVLPLEREWALAYEELIALWTAGSLLIGAMALPAGWLADRWSATGMMVVFFTGLGASAIVCGLAPSPTVMWVGLCLLGSFAAIYHPVGIAWLVRTTRASRGKALGVNGIFGSAGVAVAGLVAGGLIDVAGWRVAFLVPGAATVMIGLVMLAYVRAGVIGDAVESAPTAQPTGDRGAPRAFLILLVTMFGGAVVYQAVQIAMPKLLASRMAAVTGESTLGVGALVALVYGVAALTQLAAGHLADRYDLKAVYVGTIAAQAPILWLASSAGGWPLVACMTALVVSNTGTLPAENLLLAGATPARRHGVAFGLKFVLAFGAAPIAVQLVAALYGASGGFVTLLSTLAAIATGALVTAVCLPGPADWLGRAALAPSPAPDRS